MFGINYSRPSWQRPSTTSSPSRIPVPPKNPARGLTSSVTTQFPISPRAGRFPILKSSSGTNLRSPSQMDRTPSPALDGSRSQTMGRSFSSILGLSATLGRSPSSAAGRSLSPLPGYSHTRSNSPTPESRNLDSSQRSRSPSPLPIRGTYASAGSAMIGESPQGQSSQTQAAQAATPPPRPPRRRAPPPIPSSRYFVPSEKVLARRAYIDSEPTSPGSTTFSDSEIIGDSPSPANKFLPTISPRNESIVEIIGVRRHHEDSQQENGWESDILEPYSQSEEDTSCISNAKSNYLSPTGATFRSSEVSIISTDVSDIGDTGEGNYSNASDFAFEDSIIMSSTPRRDYPRSQSSPYLSPTSIAGTKDHEKSLLPKLKPKAKSQKIQRIIIRPPPSTSRKYVPGGVRLPYRIAKELRRRGGTALDTTIEPKMLYFTRPPRMEFVKALSRSARFGSPRMQKLIAEIANSDTAAVKMSTHFWF